MSKNSDKPMLWNVTYMVAVIETDWETNLVYQGALPFFPSVGMQIDCGEGNCRKVEDVFWLAESAHLAIQFEDETKWTPDVMQSWGWKEEE